MVSQVILGFCGESGTLGTLQFYKRTPLLAESKIRPCNLGTTIVTSNVFATIEGRHFDDRSITEFSEINVLFVAK